MTDSTNTRILISLLVGAHFYPPAKILLSHLPAGAELALVPEPDNPYDPNALQVWVGSSELAEAGANPDFDLALAGCGLSASEVLGQPQWMLGHVATAQNKELAQAGLMEHNISLLKKIEETGSNVARLGFTGAGKPTVIL